MFDRERSIREHDFAVKLASIAHDDALAKMARDRFIYILVRQMRDGVCHIEDEQDRKKRMIVLARRLRQGRWDYAED